VNKLLARLLLVSATVGCLAAAQATQQTFSGVVTDDNCDNGDHSHMKMGDNDRECTVACIDSHGASYVLYDGKTAYKLSDQKTPEKFAGGTVRVVGVLDAKTKTIQVSSITALK
jgi:hypothetical protein